MGGGPRSSRVLVDQGQGCRTGEKAASPLWDRTATAPRLRLRREQQRLPRPRSRPRGSVRGDSPGPQQRKRPRPRQQPQPRASISTETALGATTATATAVAVRLSAGLALCPPPGPPLGAPSSFGGLTKAPEQEAAAPVGCVMFAAVSLAILAHLRTMSPQDRNGNGLLCPVVWLTSVFSHGRRHLHWTAHDRGCEHRSRRGRRRRGAGSRGTRRRGAGSGHRTGPRHSRRRASWRRTQIATVSRT